MLPEGNWISRAPSLRRKAILLAKVQDEPVTASISIRAAETLGTAREEMKRGAPFRQGQVQHHLQLPDPGPGADIGAIGWLVDGRRDHEPGAAAAHLLRAPMRAPWSGFARRESFHQRQGLRDHDGDVRRHRRPEADGAGRNSPAGGGRR
jgi:1,2-phenylacetyl-CoA epoxidase catalytic subunit